MSDNRRISASDLTYCDKTNDEIDIALIAISPSVDIHHAYERSNCLVVDDFRSYSFDGTNVLLHGLPGDLARLQDGTLGVRDMSYMTVQADQRDKNFLYGTYENDKDDNLLADGTRTTLPQAKGFSGAFVFQVWPFDAASPDIWTAESSLRIVAVQSAWRPRNYFKAANVGFVFGLLDNMANSYAT